MTGDLVCTDDTRRDVVRARGLNGIEAINVSPDQLTLTVLFMGNAPDDLKPANFVIEGGVRVTDVKVVTVRACDDHDPGTADCIQLTVDKFGDQSTYRLCVVEAGRAGTRGETPYPSFDPRYACADFSFKQNCPDLLDCFPADECVVVTYATPEIDYLAKDYTSFRQLLLDRMSLTLPDWTERHVPDLELALVEALAYIGDRLSYKQDAVATEAYLETARRRVSVRRHARLVDYAMHDGCAARAWVCIETAEDLTLPAGDFRLMALPPELPSSGAVGIVAGDLDQQIVEQYETFEPVTTEDVTLHPAHNRIELWAWGDEECCLRRGAVSAVLVDTWVDDPAPDEREPETDKAPTSQDDEPDNPDGNGAADRNRALELEPGDVLILREQIGPVTGLDADADPTHCQAVRLTSVSRTVDELFDQPLVEITWAREDALTFDLCVRARGGADCTDQHIGVANGNVVLVEHGRSICWCGGAGEPHDGRPLRSGTPGCPDCAFGCRCVAKPVVGPPYPPEHGEPVVRLVHSPVTQSVAFPSSAAVARAQAVDLRGLPRRVHRRVVDMLRRAHDGHPPTAAEVEGLARLFGAALLRRLRLSKRPEEALEALDGRFDEYLADKLDRLARLTHRAHDGYVLTDEEEGWEIGQSWGDDERERLNPARPAFRGPAATATLSDPRLALPAVTVAVDGQTGDPWTPRRDLLSSAPTDRHFVGETDDDAVTTLRFGDGTNGAAPPPASAVTACYRIGNGRVGNVGRRAINRIVFCSTHTDAITDVWNPIAAAGGTDPEPVDDVRDAAPSEMLRHLLRAITAADYAALAGQVAGVQRAGADLRWTGSWYEAQVCVDPSGRETTPAWLLGAVRRDLHLYRRLGHDVAVSSARLVPLDLAVHIQVSPDSVAAHVRAAVLRVLGTGVLTDGRLGFFHPDNLTFGSPVRISQIVAAVAAVPGVQHTEVTRLQPLFGPTGDALTTGILRLPPLSVAQLDNDSTRPDKGLLTLDLGGGR